jgi:membrane dipeptidase
VLDVENARRENKLAVFYNIQNSTPIERNLDRVALLKGLGLTAIQLTYNDHNHAGTGCFTKDDTGLTSFGRELIEQMASDRMLVDLSHAGMKTMAGAIAASPRPVIISHTACKALRNHPRNTTDENIRALADHGGVMGMAQMRTFMTDAKTNNLDVYFDHIQYAVKVAGVDHVGIGSDRDHRVIPHTEEEIAALLREEGAQFKPSDWPLYLEKLNGPRRMEVVRDELSKRKLPQSAIDKIMGMNVHRIYQSVVG